MVNLLNHNCRRTIIVLITILLFSGGYLFFCITLSQAADVDALFRGYRGINVTLRSRPTDTDLDKLAAWGVNLIRLVIYADPENPNYDGFYAATDANINAQAFVALDKLVDAMQRRKFSVILDLHTFPGVTNGKIWKEFKYWDMLEELWSFIAIRYRNHSTIIGYELMNEPRLVIDNLSSFGRLQLRRGVWEFPIEWQNTPRDYYRLIERLGQTINKIDPKKYIVVPGVGFWGDPVNFRWMRPVNVQKVIYTFHLYLPSAFADSGKNGRPVVHYEPKKSKKLILESMEPVVRFSQRYHAKIFVGEFGLTWFSEGMGAEKWMRDVIDYFEQNGWSWAYWAYSIPFRNPEIIKKEDGSLEKRSDTERLRVLREYWSKNGIM